jgi:hypothetical protein
MADYSFSPQFANLSGLQPLPALDVTRGAALQFQPLQAIQIQSSRPELVAEGIAGAVSSIAQGALSGITAKYEKEEAEEKEKRKYAHELMLYGAKEKSDNADFYAKEEARFISENSGKPGFAKKYDEFKKAYSGFSDRVPETKVDKEPSDYKTVEEPLPDAEFLDSGDIPEERPGVFSWKPAPRMPQEKPALEAMTVSTTAAPPAQVLEELPEPERRPQVVTTQKKQIEGVDYTKYPEPPSYGQIETDEEAQNLASELNNQLKDTNPDYEYKVINLGKAEEYKTVVPVSIRDKRIGEQQDIASAQREQRKEAREEAEAERKSQEAEEKSGKITKANVSQYKTQVDQAASSVREINDLISLINENPLTSVGGWSTIASKIPGNSPAKIARGMIKTIHATTALNAMIGLKQASPTGASGLGGLTEGEREALASTEGSFDLDNLPSEYIIPRLERLRDARLKLIKMSGSEIKKVDPEFNLPELQYPSLEKKPSKSKKEMISAIHPNGARVKIDKKDIEAAKKEGYQIIE